MTVREQFRVGMAFGILDADLLLKGKKNPEAKKRRDAAEAACRTNPSDSYQCGEAYGINRILKLDSSSRGFSNMASLFAAFSEADLLQWAVQNKTSVDVERESLVDRAKALIADGSATNEVGPQQNPHQNQNRPAQKISQESSKVDRREEILEEVIKASACDRDALVTSWFASREESRKAREAWKEKCRGWLGLQWGMLHTYSLEGLEELEYFADSVALDDLREDIVEELLRRESAKTFSDADRIEHYRKMRDYIAFDRETPSRKGKLILKAVDESKTPEELQERLDGLETSFNILSDDIPDDQWFFLHELLESARECERTKK